MNLVRQTLSLSALLIAAPVVLAESETRDLQDFDSIAVGGGIELTITRADSFKVEVTTDDGDLDEVLTEVRGGKLIIRRDFEEDGWRGWRNRDWNSDDYSVSVTLPALKSLEASGGSNVDAEGTFAGDRMTINTSGGSDVTIEVAVEVLRITSSGGSNLDISGTAGRLRANTSGGSDVDASDLTAKEADISASGASDVSVAVTESITADASGSSDIYYSGDPKDKDIDESGAGDVRHH